MTLKKYIIDNYKYLQSIKYIFKDYIKARKINKNNDLKIPNFYNDNATVDLIVNHNMSLSRFGDGEFGWMAGQNLSSFQEYSEDFAQELRNAFCSNNPKLLIGIPIGLFNKRGLNLFSKMYWDIIKASSYSSIANLVSYDKKYTNASITRPYIDYRNREFSKNAFKNIRRIWDNRKIIIVEGENSKLGVGNDLFDNATHIRRIICPSINAFSKIRQIEEFITNNIDKNSLLLGALGPTASILASHLSNQGYQFIDIGHIDIEYMWFINHCIIRDPIPGKYVNESSEKIIPSNSTDQEYIKSIITRIV